MPLIATVKSAAPSETHTVGPFIQQLYSLFATGHLVVYLRQVQQVYLRQIVQVYLRQIVQVYSRQIVQVYSRQVVIVDQVYSQQVYS